MNGVPRSYSDQAPVYDQRRFNGLGQENRPQMHLGRTSYQPMKPSSDQNNVKIASAFQPYQRPSFREIAQNNKYENKTNPGSIVNLSKTMNQMSLNYNSQYEADQHQDQNNQQSNQNNFGNQPLQEMFYRPNENQKANGF